MGLNLGQGQGEYDQSWVFSSGGDTNEVQRGKPVLSPGAERSC